MRKHLIVAAAGMMAFALLSNNAWAFNSDPDPLTPSQVKAQLAKAQSSISVEKYRSASRTLNDIIKANPRNANAYNLLGFSYRK